MSSLAFAIDSLRDADFAKQTVTPRKNGNKPLKAKEEIGANALWRYLQIAGYITSSHTLSPLGDCLQRAFAQSGKPEFEEPIVLALELLRLDLLNADNMFPTPPYHGAPFRGSEIDQRNTLLVSRVACLGKLRHKSIGYTGPLSRHLLAYHSIISTVRDSQRDLLEMSLCAMLMAGNVARDTPEKDLQDVAFT